MTKTIIAKDSYDLAALIAVRRALEAGAEQVRVEFPELRVFRPPVLFEQKDLPAIRQKITYSM